MKKSILFLLLFLSFNMFGQDISYEVSVSKSKVLAGNKFKVTYTINNADLNNFEPSSFEGFELVSGPNTSSSFSSVNGNTTRALSYSFILVADNEGTFEIEGSEIEIDGVKYSSVAIIIEVLPNPDGIIESISDRDQDPFNDFFNDRNSIFDFPTTPRTPDVESPEPPKKKRKTYKL